MAASRSRARATSAQPGPSHAGRVDSMYLTQGLHRSLQRYPAKVALRHVAGDMPREYTFERLVCDIAQHAAALQAHGVRLGDRVAMLSPNNDALIAQLF